MFLLGWLMVESGLESDINCKNGTFVWGWSFFSLCFRFFRFFFFGGFFFFVSFLSFPFMIFVCLLQ